jgi:hypothetical protein
MRLNRSFNLALLGVLAAVTGACSDPNELPPATQRNFIDTLTVFALHDTPVQTPSGFSVPDGPVRTDRTTGFDFAYDVDTTGGDTVRYFLPQAVLDIRVSNSVNPGLQRRTETFDGIRNAPSNGYITRDSIPVDSGQVFIVRSRIVCAIGVSLYAKIEILKFVDSTRTVDLKVLANTNCGYKRLTPGIPSE